MTQIVSPSPYLPMLHNRQTHSEKVALLAKEIAEDLIRDSQAPSSTLATSISSLGGIDSIVCEAAGLAHDLGHPPFGHLGERVLDDFMRYRPPFDAMTADSGSREPFNDQRDLSYLIWNEETYRLCDIGVEGTVGFEGNAQTFRILTRLEPHKVVVHGPVGDGLFNGLNLTNSVLAAVLKYPWWRSDTKSIYRDKYNVYEEDLGPFRWARSWVPNDIGRMRPTLEASIMDTADDITYAIHDLQDFFMAGLFDPGAALRLCAEQKAKMNGVAYVDFGDPEREEDQRRELDNDKLERLTPIPLEKTYRLLCRRYETMVNRELFLEQLEDVERFLKRTMSERFDGSMRQHGVVQGKFSELMGELIAEVKFHENPPSLTVGHVLPDSKVFSKIKILEALAKGLIVETPFVGLTQQSQRTAMVNLLRGLNSWLLNSPIAREIPEPLFSFLKYMPVGRTRMDVDDEDGRQPVHGKLEDNSRFVHKGVPTRRCISDFVCTLTDWQAMRWSEWLKGRSLPPLGELI